MNLLNIILTASFVLAIFNHTTPMLFHRNVKLVAVAFFAAVVVQYIALLFLWFVFYQGLSESGTPTTEVGVKTFSNFVTVTTTLTSTMAVTLLVLVLFIGGNAVAWVQSVLLPRLKKVRGLYATSDTYAPCGPPMDLRRPVTESQ